MDDIKLKGTMVYLLSKENWLQNIIGNARKEIFSSIYFGP